jgi:coenzyme F420 hydrogenase subunit beta
MTFTELNNKVISTNLCARCGACIGVCPVNVITPDDTALPRLSGKCTDCGLCLKVCPGADFDFPKFYKNTYNNDFSLKDCMGHYENTFVCQSMMPEILNGCSSGGAATSIALALIRSGEVSGVGVVTMDEKKPYQAKAILTKDEKTIIKASQSKYMLVPMLELLRQMKKQGGEYAILLLPCQGMALKKIQEAAPNLAKHVKYVLGLKCHYNMKSGTINELMARYGLNADNIARLEYRGGEWPGAIQFTLKDGSIIRPHITLIKTVLSYLFSLYSPDRCLMCPAGTCVFSDISMGDFWAQDYSDEFRKLCRHTLVIQRTAKGKRMLDIAEKEKLLKVRELPASQESRRIARVFMDKRRLCNALIATNRKKGYPTPEYHYPIEQNTLDRLCTIYSTPYYLLRKPRKIRLFRKLFLRFFFSNAGLFISHLNAIKRKLFFKLSG